MNNGLKELQQIELDIFKFFHQLCIDHSLIYYAVGGTLLGAVRHSGFIPWDDDMDFAMPRSDYEKFLKIVKDINNENIKLITNPLNLNITQLVNPRIRIKLGEVESFAFIDIFPLDGYPEGKIYSFFYNKKILFYRMLCKLSIIDILDERDRGYFENMLVYFTKFTRINKLLDTEKLVNKLHYIIKQYSFSSSSRSGNILGRYRNKEVVDKSIWGKPKLIRFEDTEIFAPEKEKEYLQIIYNDFMKLPTKSEQKSHNIEILRKDIDI